MKTSSRAFIASVALGLAHTAFAETPPAKTGDETKDCPVSTTQFDLYGTLAAEPEARWDDYNPHAVAVAHHEVGARMVTSLGCQNVLTLGARTGNLTTLYGATSRQVRGTVMVHDNAQTTDVNNLLLGASYAAPDAGKGEALTRDLLGVDHASAQIGLGHRQSWSLTDSLTLNVGGLLGLTQRQNDGHGLYASLGADLRYKNLAVGAQALHDTTPNVGNTVVRAYGHYRQNFGWGEANFNAERAHVSGPTPRNLQALRLTLAAPLGRGWSLELEAAKIKSTSTITTPNIQVSQQEFATYLMNHQDGVKSVSDAGTNNQRLMPTLQAIAQRYGMPIVQALKNNASLNTLQSLGSQSGVNPTETLSTLQAAAEHANLPALQEFLSNSTLTPQQKIVLISNAAKAELTSAEQGLSSQLNLPALETSLNSARDAIDTLADKAGDATNMAGFQKDTVAALKQYFLRTPEARDFGARFVLDEAGLKNVADILPTSSSGFTNQAHQMLTARLVYKSQEGRFKAWVDVGVDRADYVMFNGLKLNIDQWNAVDQQPLRAKGLVPSVTLGATLSF